MKILAISGGFTNGNNDAMAREVLMGAKEQGADIEFIHLLDLNLKPCTGCVACVNSIMSGNKGDCIIKDDLKWLEEKLYDADGIVFVMPIFEKGAPAVLHLIQDRLFGPSHDPGVCTVSKKIAEHTGGSGPDERKFIPKVVSFISIGGSDWNTMVSAVMNTVAMAPGWKVIDDLVFEWGKSVALDDDAVAKCHQVGLNIAEAAKAGAANAEYQGDNGLCAVCHSRNFFLKDDKAICCVCGIVGEIKNENGRYSFAFPEEQNAHAHTSFSGKMMHMDDIYHYETKLNEQKKTPEYKERMQKYKDFIQPSKP